MKLIPILAIIALSGCASTAQQAVLNQVITNGQLYCAEATATGPLVVALASTSGVPQSVIGKTSDEVKALCNLVNGVPVSPPPAPSQAPVVAAPAAVALNGVKQ